MSQDITCLITDKNIELNKDVVHFKVHGFTFIPFNTYYYFMQVIEGTIIKNSIVSDESEQSKNNKAHVPESKKKFGLTFDWLSHTDLFYSYFHANRIYSIQQTQ